MQHLNIIINAPEGVVIVRNDPPETPCVLLQSFTRDPFSGILHHIDSAWCDPCAVEYEAERMAIEAS